MDNNTNMNKDNYKCDKILLNEEFSEALKKTIHEIITRVKYVHYNVTVRKITTGGNNFLGELYEIDIDGETSETKNENNIFLKRIIQNDDFRIYSIPEVYKKEAFFYKELSKIFNELQENVNIPAEDRFKMVKSYEETNDEVIILENLTKKNFKTMFRMDVMSIEFAKLSIEQLAKFHGLSFALQKKRPEYFETKIKTIKQSMVYDDYWNEFVTKMCELSVSKLNDVTKEKISKFFEYSLDKYPKYMNGLHSQIKCLCHGDYKMNNIIFKEEDGKITEAIPIDFQQIYFGCPVIDLIYFIYAASDRDFRKQHLYHLKDLYYETLTRFLNYFAIDVSTVCPRDEFEECFKHSLDYALMYTLYMLQMFFVTDDIPDISKDELLEMKIQVDDRFYDRMQGIVDDFIDLGVL
ncbi:uncharacterized protein LOC125069202 [Vanessa atalanta]|uniref:uncharacterized protein LOC125069202 n=1 Tax=Vanessa atalanta TaxID=42275 RepID=UPI001FCD089F|nr:uncharacterized protein LOC125069202 [Vanessa atalanta]